MINKIILILILFSGLTFASSISSTGRVSGSGTSKMEAYANAISRVPYGGIVIHVGYNGYSMKDYNTGITRGKYTCYITWRK
jgi:hypothetical protein